jgi:hypothetical protein
MEKPLFTQELLEKIQKEKAAFWDKFWQVNERKEAK